MKIWCLVVFASLLSCSALARKIPSYVQVCNTNDPAYDKCVLKSIEAIKPRLAKGIPKLQVPPAEPLVIPALEIVRDLENLKVTANLQNIQVFGASNFQVDKLKTNLDDPSVDASLTLPFLDVSTDYVIDGRLLVVPLKGRGVFKGNFTNVKVDIKGKAKAVTRNGEQYLEIEKISTRVRVGDANFKIRSATPNDLITSTAANFISQNKQQVFQIISPIIEETADEVATQFANRIMGSVPMSEFLPK